jgi:hypothetical protein
MAVDVIGNFTEQYPVMLEDPVGFTCEWRECVGKVIVRLCGRFGTQAKSDLEIFAAVFALIWNVRRVIYYDIECLRFEGHVQAGAQNIRSVPNVDVHP